MIGSRFTAEFDLDHRINRRGIMVDVQTAAAIDKAIQAETKRLNYQLSLITDGQVTSSRQHKKMLDWLKGRGYPADDLQADTVKYVLESPGGMDTHSMEALRLRQKTSLGSLAKFGVMVRAADDDQRMRGLFQLYGASQTGRWAGRLVQFQNLPRMSIKDTTVQALIGLFAARDVETIRMVYGDLAGMAKELIRPMFIGDPGLVVSDLAQIECRVLAWLAGCDRLVELFASTDRDPYAEMAAEIYCKPATECGKGTTERHVGKACLLGAGYGLGAARFGLMNDLEEETAQHIIRTYRGTFPEIPKFWRASEAAVNEALASGRVGRLADGRIRVAHEELGIEIRLPSGRRLQYPNMKVDPELGLVFQSSLGKENYTWGGTLVENIVQAVARDILCEAMLKIDAAGLSIVGHVHDEVIVESGNPVDVETITQIMIDNPPWAEGLPLAAETAICERYTK